MNDLKEKIEEVVNKVKNDQDFARKFETEPVKALESVVGVDLPDDKVNEIINGIKAKINFDNSGFMNTVKGFFN